MSDDRRVDPKERVAREQAVFLQDWQTYRKVLDNNYMFHREVYALIHRILLADAVQPFRFLDLGCGDASATATALQGTSVAHYFGVDISGPALEIARQELSGLTCPVILYQRDFVEALAEWADPIDVVWIGQSLHHLLADGKLELMQHVRRALGPGGLFLIWEPTTLEGEDRREWLARFETGSRPLWSSLTESEWTAILSHVRAADYPETPSTWLALGRQAGFRSVSEVFLAPTKLARVYCLRD